MARRVIGEACRSGPGLHTGSPCRAWIRPAAAGAGLMLGPPGHALPLDPARALAEPGATSVVGEGWRIGVVEHLLAACVGLGVQDVIIEVEGPELPALDGASAVWCAALRDAGLADTRARPLRRLAAPVTVVDYGGSASAWPDAHPEIRVEVDFGARLRGEAAWRPPWGQPGGDFAGELGWARTFVLAEQVPALREAGRGRGATAENTLVLHEHGPEPSWLAPDEPVRHKLLDLIGDLAWAGGGWAASVRVTRGSHRLHLALVRAMLAQESIG